MKKALRYFTMLLVIDLVIALAAASALALWLWTSGRLSQERVDAAIAMFSKTTDQEKTDRAEAEAMAKASGQRRRQEEALSKGLDSAAAAEQRLLEQRRAAAQKQLDVQRRLDDIKRIEASIKRMTLALKDEEAKLAEREKQLQVKTDSLVQGVTEEGFQKTVKMLEGLPPKQVKNIFIDMLKDPAKGSDQIVEYLAAMQPRKAAAVLGEFKDQANEVPQAKRLLEQLRAGGKKKEPLG